MSNTKCDGLGHTRSCTNREGPCDLESSLSPTQAPLIERRLELSEELRNGLAGVIAKQDEELKLLRAKVSALSPHPPTSEERFALDVCRMVLHWYESDSSEYNRELAIKACRDALSEDTAWKCKARAATDPPQDCDWPCCGCDPHADKVIAALEESGKLDGSLHQLTSEEELRLRTLIILRLVDAGCIGDDEQGCTRDDDDIPIDRWCVNCLMGRVLSDRFPVGSPHPPTSEESKS